MSKFFKEYNLSPSEEKALEKVNRACGRLPEQCKITALDGVSQFKREACKDSMRAKISNTPSSVCSDASREAFHVILQEFSRNS